MDQTIEPIVNAINQWLDDLVDAGKIVEISPVTRGEIKRLAEEIRKVSAAGAER